MQGEYSTEFIILIWFSWGRSSMDVTDLNAESCCFGFLFIIFKYEMPGFGSVRKEVANLMMMHWQHQAKPGGDNLCMWVEFGMFWYKGGSEVVYHSKPGDIDGILSQSAFPELRDCFQLSFLPGDGLRHLPEEFSVFGWYIGLHGDLALQVCIAAVFPWSEFMKVITLSITGGYKVIWISQMRILFKEKSLFRLFLEDFCLLFFDEIYLVL